MFHYLEIILSFEAHLKEINPRQRQLSYSLTELLNYIDSLVDISALVFEDKIRAYVPHDRQWIKAKISALLQKSTR